MSFGNAEIIKIMTFNKNDLQKQILNKFVHIIYNNFYDLTKVVGSDHSIESIYIRLQSPDIVVLLAIHNDLILGYLIADRMQHNDMDLLHIYYLYVSNNHRNIGIATYLLNKIDDYAHNLDVDAISLTYDTYDKKLEKFYYNRKYEVNSRLRSFKRHDMLVKYV